MPVFVKQEMCRYSFVIMITPSSYIFLLHKREAPFYNEVTNQSVDWVIDSEWLIDSEYYLDTSDTSFCIPSRITDRKKTAHKQRKKNKEETHKHTNPPHTHS